MASRFDRVFDQAAAMRPGDRWRLGQSDFDYLLELIRANHRREGRRRRIELWLAQTGQLPPEMRAEV